jgi:hypothetical protein
MQEKWSITDIDQPAISNTEMKSLIVISLIVAFMFIGYLLNNLFQQIIKPRQSFGRLLFYFLAVLASVFLLSFLMVLVISKLYPGELIK